MAPVDNTFYERLGVEPLATPEDIKHAYRKKALQLHPDKGGDPEQFKAMKEAYDVLSDAQKRSLYDQYGPDIVRMSEGNMVSPDVLLMALSRVGRKERTIALLLLLSVALALVSPALLVSLRWDGAVHMSWLMAFLPFWVFQAVAWCFLLTVITPPPEGNEEGMDEEERAANLERRRMARALRASISLKLLLLFALEVFMALRLDGSVKWSWYLVLLPWLLLELLWLLSAVRQAAQASSADAGGGRSPPSFASCLFREAGWGVLRLITWSLLAARADNMLATSWYLCFSPIFLGSFLELASSCRKKGRSSGSADAERPEGSSQMEDEEEEESSGAGMTCCGVLFLLIVACGAAAKLDGAHYSAFLVFSPLFLIVCGFTCVFCCAVVNLSPEFVAELRRQEQENLNRTAGSTPEYGAAASATPGAQAAGAGAASGADSQA